PAPGRCRVHPLEADIEFSAELQDLHPHGLKLLGPELPAGRVMAEPEDMITMRTLDGRLLEVHVLGPDGFPAGGTMEGIDVAPGQVNGLEHRCAGIFRRGGRVLGIGHIGAITDWVIMPKLRNRLRMSEILPALAFLLVVVVDLPAT